MVFKIRLKNDWQRLFFSVCGFFFFFETKRWTTENDYVQSHWNLRHFTRKLIVCNIYCIQTHMLILIESMRLPFEIYSKLHLDSFRQKEFYLKKTLEWLLFRVKLTIIIHNINVINLKKQTCANGIQWLGLNIFEVICRLVIKIFLLHMRRWKKKHQFFFCQTSLQIKQK